MDGSECGDGGLGGLGYLLILNPETELATHPNDKRIDSQFSFIEASRVVSIGLSRYPLQPWLASHDLFWLLIIVLRYCCQFSSQFINLSRLSICSPNISLSFIFA